MKFGKCVKLNIKMIKCVSIFIPGVPNEGSNPKCTIIYLFFPNFHDSCNNSQYYGTNYEYYIK